MKEKIGNLRKILSMNIKKQRETLCITQEKLAENAGISVNMVKDIEGCRTWISDKTLIRLASALEIDIYRLFISPDIYEEEVYKKVVFDLTKVIKKIKKDMDNDFSKALKMWSLK
jgi:transcriptional regulator with XRE-family HTH domain